MILLLPIGFLLLAALLISILNRFNPKFGIGWLIASAASIITWLTYFFMRLRLPTMLNVLSWEGSSLNLIGQFSLLMDYDTWPYAFSLITITLAVILTDAARTRYDSTPLSWAASLAITSLGLLALQSGTSLTLMVTWVMVDLIELLYLLRLEDVKRFHMPIVFSYGVRTASILMLFLASIQTWQINESFRLTEIPVKTGILFLLSAGLRLGVLPLNLPFLQEPNLRRGAGNIIRLAPVISSLSLLARLPVNLMTGNLQGWIPLLQSLIAIAALYAATRWFSASDEIEGRPFWIIAWSSLAAACVLNGAPAASIAWGIALILPGSLLFLYSPRIQRMNFLLYFGLIGLIGLPFTPLASGWSGLAANGITGWTILFTLAHAIMVLGYLKRILQPSGEVGALESWARLVYPLGLIINIQAIVAIGLIGWPGSLTLGTWWLGLISNILIISAIILVWRLGISPPYVNLPASSGFKKVLDWLLPRLEPIFRLEWLYKILWWIKDFLSIILKALSSILESEGGILWTVLLMVLLISILAGVGAN
ncbi:MAG: hypothetical protein U9R53_10795 [Chloroflexota bacterium]|nr:hypothetical protein [Chloroflexota bacterium]